MNIGSEKINPSEAGSSRSQSHSQVSRSESLWSRVRAPAPVWPSTRITVPCQSVRHDGDRRILRFSATLTRDELEKSLPRDNFACVVT